MKRWLWRVFIPAAAVVLVVPLAVLTLRAPAHPAHASSAVQAAQGQASCIGHHPQEYIWYAAGCTGHDEPEIDPLSNNPGSAKDLTWTIVLPSNGTTRVDAVGPTFWIGGAVTDPVSLLGQAFLELQFYPNSLLTSCTNTGGFNVTFVAGDYTACSPVWAVSPNKKGKEYAAFNAMLTDSSGGGPLVMHAGDTITDHQYVTAAQDGMHITVTDLSTGHSGTIVLNTSTGRAGALMPAFDTQQIGNSLGWGLVHDAPNSLVWEIGHTGPFTDPASQFCLPGSATNPACYSYNVPTWTGFQPLQVKSVVFGDNSKPSGWAVVSDFGGKAEINQYCGAANYGTPFCWYPWFAYNTAAKYFTYGGDYPGDNLDFNQADQFTQTTQCGGPFGANSTYCATVLSVPGVH